MHHVVVLHLCIFIHLLAISRREPDRGAPVSLRYWSVEDRHRESQYLSAGMPQCYQITNTIFVLFMEQIKSIVYWQIFSIFGRDERPEYFSAARLPLRVVSTNDATINLSLGIVLVLSWLKYALLVFDE